MRIRRRVSPKGLEFIASWEGFVPTAYKPVPGEQYWTIGYGHYGPDVRPGQKVTVKQALKLLRKDARVASKAVNDLVRVKLNQNQFDALVSFTFNVGTGAFADSTLLRRLNKGEYHEVPVELNKWVYGASGRLEGLVRRRAAEGRLFARSVRRR